MNFVCMHNMMAQLGIRFINELDISLHHRIGKCGFILNCLFYWLEIKS